jgi:hypothetical protein
LTAPHTKISSNEAPQTNFFSVGFLVNPFAGGVRRIGTESLSERASSSTETERNNRLSSSKTQKPPSIFERKAGENKPSSEKQEKINQTPYFFRKSTKCVEVQTPRAPILASHFGDLCTTPPYGFVVR